MPVPTREEVRRGILYMILSVAVFAVAIFAMLPVDLLSFGQRLRTRRDEILKLFRLGQRYPITRGKKQRRDGRYRPCLLR